MINSGCNDPSKYKCWKLLRATLRGGMTASLPRCYLGYQQRMRVFDLSCKKYRPHNLISELWAEKKPKKKFKTKVRLTVTNCADFGRNFSSCGWYISFTIIFIHFVINYYVITWRARRTNRTLEASFSCK